MKNREPTLPPLPSRFPAMVGIAVFLLLMATVGAALIYVTRQQGRPPDALQTPEPTLSTDITGRWATALDSVRAAHTIRVSQNVSKLNEGWTRRIVLDAWAPPQERAKLLTTDEILEHYPDHYRYRFVAHTSRGDIITVWDGKQASRYFSWLNEVYHPLPNTPTRDLYGNNDLQYISALQILPAPSAPSYEVVGERELDGRRVIEVKHRTADASLEDERVFLDAATYLPVHTISSKALGAEQNPSEWSLTSLELNTPVTDSDFELATTTDAVTIYQTPGSVFKTFASLGEAAQEAGFSLQKSKGSQPRQNPSVLSLVEKDGKLYPVIQLLLDNALDLQEGIYLPRYNRFSLYESIAGSPQAILSGHQQATLQISTGGAATITLEKDGTVIQIAGSFSAGQAQRVISDLEPVE